MTLNRNPKSKLVTSLWRKTLESAGLPSRSGLGPNRSSVDCNWTRGSTRTYFHEIPFNQDDWRSMEYSLFINYALVGGIKAKMSGKSGSIQRRTNTLLNILKYWVFNWKHVLIYKIKYWTNPSSFSCGYHFVFLLYSHYSVGAVGGAIHPTWLFDCPLSNGDDFL